MRRAVRAGGPALAATALFAVVAAQPAGAQDDRGRLPVIPSGVPVVVLPVQSVHPLLGGAWPGGGKTMQETLETLGAELAFALGEQRGAEAWVMPGDVVERASRNPVVQVDPTRLAYHALLWKPARRDQLSEPLHGQLRRLAALFGARIVALPLRVWYEPEPASGGGETGGRGTLVGGAEGTGPEGSPLKARAEPRGRAVLLLAIIDVRTSRVLWWGRIEGDLAEPRSRALLATLAHRVARQLAPQ